MEQRGASGTLARLLDAVPPGLRRPRAVAATVAVGTVAAVAAFVLLRPPAGPAPALRLPQAGADTTVAVPHGGTEAPGTTTPVGAASTAAVTADAAGDVVGPGVYSLPAGARVADLLTAAGGPQPDADLDRLNLAAHVSDGDRVYVPRRGEVVPPDVAGTGLADADGSGASGGATGSSGPTTSAAPIDLNAATAEQLDALPGVGPAIAQAIVTYRTTHGRFRSVNDLLNVPGIGPAKLEAVRSLVRV